MRELTNVDISKNSVDTIAQYHILDYLKKNLDIDNFKIYLVNRNSIKVIDKVNDILYFTYNEENKEITYHEEKEYKYEMEF